MMQHDGRLPQIRACPSSRENDLDASEEVEVIKAILQREGYMDRARSQIASPGSQFSKNQGALDDLITTLDLLRSATLDTVEATAQWRRAQGHTNPFIWGGMNYLLKIPTDLNFLDEYKVLRSWMGFSLRRNPFVVSISLERLVDIPGEELRCRERVFPMDKKGFTDVGGASQRHMRTAARNLRQTEGGNSTSPSFRARSTVIADSDMVRIRAAAAIILREEAVCGRFTVDGSGRCVPVDVAENLTYSHVLGLDNYIETHIPANLPPKLAPFTDLAEVGRVPDSKGITAASACAAFGDSTTYAGNRREPSRGIIGLSASGKANAQRVGGKLLPVAVNTASPRKTKPVTRSVGAMLRAEMMRRKQQNKRLQQELEILRHKLMAAQAQSLVNKRQQEHLRPHTEDHTSLYTPNTREHLRDVPIENVGEEALTMKRKSEELERKVRQQVALEEKYHEFRAKEVRVQNKTRAMVLERKRRLLEQDPDGFQPTDDDDYTLEEQAATQVQRITRGMQGRTRVRNLRPLLNNAATKIQGIMRGHLGRAYAEVKRTDELAVTTIQRVWRGNVGRSIFKSNRSKLERHMGARDIQRILRGRIGRRRVRHKRSLRGSASRGAAVVGVKQLFHQDIVELADAIDALCERGKAPPPSIVLGLLKLVALMIEQDEESGAITWYSTLGVRSVDKLEASHQFSWRDAVRLLRRSSKLLRRLRQVAAGPASKRPRMVYFVQTAVLTYRALRCDHGWNVTTLGRVGAGAKACQHLMMWVDALQQVFAYQREFANDLGSDRMPWVARAQQSLSCMRHLELSRMVWEHAVACLQKVLGESHGASPKQGVFSCNADGRRGDLRLCVAESALEISNDREKCARDALCRMRKEEEQAQGLDLVREEFNMGVLADDLNHAEADLTEAYTRLEAVRRAARDGIQTHQEHLLLCLDELTTAEIVRKERWSSFEMFRTQMKRDAKRRGVNVEVWGNLRHEVRVVGEMEAASVLAAQDLRFFRCDSKPDEPDGSCIHESKALQRGADEAQSLATAGWGRLDLSEEEKEYAYATASEAELQSEEAVLLHEWGEPTEEEREEDLREDEQCARREAEAAAQFVPSAMLVRPFKRPRPVIICLSRDVPLAAKENIVRRFESDLPGMTVYIDAENNMGLHVGDLQQALSVRFCVICNVDTGVGARCRSAFLQRLASVKDALIPTPNFVLVMGDNKNRSGGPLDSSVGCSGRDLAAMEDGCMKKFLEDTARIVQELRHPTCLGAMANMGRQVIPPSYSHTLVMEALVILLSPKKVFHNHVPLSSMRGVTWTEARHLLDLPDKLWASMARVDLFNIPAENISTLQAYIDHDYWPRKGGAPSGDANILDSLATWAYFTVEFSVLLEKSGGCPPALCRYSTSSAGLLAAVVPVHDEHFDGQQRDKAQCTRGWTAAYHQTLSAVLEDVRVFRVAQFVRGARPGSVHLTEVYQECGRLFFHAYDPESCVSNFFVMEERKVSHLLAPSLDEPPEPGSTAIPCDRQDLFGRLVALLSFETVASDTAAGKRLTCQRRLRRLLRDTRHISGHLVQVTVCEEAKGELRYNVYLAGRSASIQLKVDARALEHVISDSDIAAGERDEITSEDTCCLLGPITDRLVISPSRTTMATMGARSGVGMVKPLLPSQGFVLKVRRKGGAGRLTLRTVCLISGASHVLTGWELGRRGLLRLAAYNPITSMTYGVRLSKTERACFGYDGENCKAWSKDLARRLSLRRANAHTVDMENIEHPPARRPMVLDKTIISTACRVAVGKMDSRLFRMRVSLVDAGRSVALDLYEDRTCKQCHILLTLDDLAGMGVWSCEVQVEQQIFVRDGNTTVDSSVEQECLITRIFGSKECKEAAVRRLTRQLRFTPDTDSVTLPVNGGTITAAMITSENMENRRPQKSFRVERLQTADTALSHAVEPCGYRGVFCQQRRQPAVLIHGDESSRRQHSRPVQDAEGKKANDSVARESPKRKKGKTKRGKTDAKPSRGDGKVDADALEVENRKKLSVGTSKLARKKEGAVRQPQEAFIDDNVDTIRSIGGTAPICAPRSGECQVFKEAVSMRIGDWEEHQPMCDTVVTVYESPSGGTGNVEDLVDNNGDLTLRVVVFYAKMAAYSEVSIKGFMDLRQVVGPLHQSLVLEWKHRQQGDGTARALFNFIFHSRAIIMAGTWDGNLDEYVEHGTDFTVILKRSRIYRSIKQTPIHSYGDEDAQANAEQLIDNLSRRGRKVFRRTVNVSSALFQVTAYELPPSDTSLDIAPTLKFVAYDPKEHTQLVTVVPSVAVLELGGGPHSPWMSQDKREVLAEILAHALRLKTAHDGSSTLVIPWSGDNLEFMDEVQVGETSRPRRDKVLACAKRNGLARLEVFSTRITGYEVVVTVFAKADEMVSVQATKAQDEEGDQSTLIFNIYCPKLSKSADVDLPHAMQKMMTGRNILQFLKGEARSAAIHRAARFLCVSLPPSSKDLQAEFLFRSHKPWLVTYNELDEDDRPSSQRPRGQPHIFIPGETEGDIITSKGVTIGGLKVLLCVHTKEKGRPGREGLVWKTYNQETCTTSILHVSASNLLEHVDYKDHLCRENRLSETIHKLTKRLVLRKAAAGGWDLYLDRKLEPWLFGGL